MKKKEQILVSKHTQIALKVMSLVVIPTLTLLISQATSLSKIKGKKSNVISMKAFYIYYNLKTNGIINGIYNLYN